MLCQEQSVHRDCSSDGDVASFSCMPAPSLHDGQSGDVPTPCRLDMSGFLQVKWRPSWRRSWAFQCCGIARRSPPAGPVTWRSTSGVSQGLRAPYLRLQLPPPAGAASNTIRVHPAVCCATRTHHSSASQALARASRWLCVTAACSNSVQCIPNEQKGLWCARCSAEELVMVGDRYMTDVVFGNRLGMLTVRPAPLTWKGDPRTVQWVRLLGCLSTEIARISQGRVRL